MKFNQFIDRQDSLKRLRNALLRTTPQFLVIYGRRRIGKSTLIKEIMQDKDVYFLSDQTNEANQRALFAKAIAYSIPRFDKVVYPDWETLLLELNDRLSERITVCLDEFPYMVKSCASLPSVIQKLLNGKTLKYDLIICGSSQQLMQGYVLDKREPLYGLADEIIKLPPIPVSYIGQALNVNTIAAVEEYSIWGGIPRYWELRADYPDMDTAIRELALDTKGILAEEPQRLLRDDLRDTIQTSTILSIIGNGVNRITEIASRAGKEATQISEPLSKLRELGYIRREIPFGESEKKSKKGIYRINDNMLQFYYRFIAPHRSILELRRIDTVMHLINAQFTQHVGDCWEHLCRQYISGNEIDGIVYNIASRWWGKIFPEGNKEGTMIELDVVAESFDKKHILIGECKWTNKRRCSTISPDSIRKSCPSSVYQRRSRSTSRPFSKARTRTSGINPVLSSRRYYRNHLTINRMKVDFNQIKTTISLPDFLLELGWKIVEGSSNSCPKMSNGTHTIVIKRNSQNQYTYWDVHSDSVRGRSIMDLMQEHLFETTGKMPTLREVGEILQNYINTNRITTPEKSRYEVGNTSMRADELQFYLSQLQPYKGNYLQKRGILKESIESRFFKDTLFIREVKNKGSVYRNVCIKMYNENGVQAISQRNETFKGIIGGKFDCLATSNHDKSRPIDILYIGESFIDCISHYQLRHSGSDLNLVYVSTEGTFTEGQMRLLRLILDKNQVKELRSIFDNDKQGHKYTLWLHRYFHGDTTDVESLSNDELRNKVRELKNVELSENKDWNDDLKISCGICSSTEDGQ